MTKVVEGREKWRLRRRITMSLERDSNPEAQMRQPLFLRSIPHPSITGSSLKKKKGSDESEMPTKTPNPLTIQSRKATIICRKA